jgi:putative membrane protein
MLNSLIYFAINVVVILVLSNILPNFTVGDVTSASIFIIVLTIVNALIVPILKVLAFPISVVTFGLINGLIIILSFVIAAAVSGVEVTGGVFEQILTYVIIAAILSFTQSMAHKWLSQ